MTNHSVPARSRAAVFWHVGQPLSIETFPISPLFGRETLIKIRCATICGSDLHSYRGRRHSPMPCILGHEMVGDVVATGPKGSCDFRGNRLQIGDRVTWSMVWSCGRCFYCERGLRPRCERLMKFGHEELVPERALIGGMAEYCHLPQGTAIFRIPQTVSDAAASPSNCATATVAAVFRNAGSVVGEIVLVHGAGMLGQTACAMAAHGGARQIVVLEPDSLRREKALAFGATLALDSTRPADEIREQLQAITDARGADVAVELSGFPEAIELGLGLLRFGGRFVLAGATFPSRPVQLLAEQVVRRMYQVNGVYNYNPEDLEAGLQFLSDCAGRYPFDELVGRAFPLDEVNAAFDFAERERPPRVAIIP